MPAGEKGGQEEFNDVVLADDDFVQFAEKVLLDGEEFIDEGRLA